MTNFATLTRMRIQLTLRNRMFLFFSVIMPFGFFFLYAGVIAKGIPRGVRYFLGPVMALTVMGLGIFTSKGSAFSAATRTSNMRTASETEMPIAASVFAALCFVFSSTRT